MKNQFDAYLFSKTKGSLLFDFLVLFALSISVIPIFFCIAFSKIFHSTKKRIFVGALAFLLLLVPLGTHAAISRDAISHGASATAPITFSHSNAGSYLVVYVDDETTDGVTGVTYNSIAMSLLAKLKLSGTNIEQYMFGLPSPSIGANNVVVSAGSNTVYAMSVSYLGANITGQPDASITNTSGSTGSPFTTSLTTVANNSWTILGSRSNVGATAGSGSNFLINRTAGADGSDNGLYDSNGPLTPAGSHSMGLTFTGTAAPIGTVMISLSPTPIPPPTAATKITISGISLKIFGKLLIQ